MDKKIIEFYFLYKDAQICFFVFDLTNLNFLNGIDDYYQNIPLYNKEFHYMLLFGNKCDDIKNRLIMKKDIENLKNKYNIPYFEISYFNGKNIIKELINYLCQLSFRFFISK